MTTNSRRFSNPLTHPATTLTTSGNRRNVAPRDRFREPTIWGVPLMVPASTQPDARSQRCR